MAPGFEKCEEGWVAFSCEYIANLLEMRSGIKGARIELFSSVSK